MSEVLFRPGSRVKALYQGQWYLGTISAFPETTGDKKGLWAVQCDSDAKGVLTYSPTVKDITSDLISDNAGLAGSTVELDVTVPDGFAAGEVLTFSYAGQEFEVPVPAGYGPGDVIRIALGNEPQAAVDLPLDGDICAGTRVEVNYGGQTYIGTVIALPAEDEEGKGRWTVQCDADAKGVFTYSETVKKISDAHCGIGSVCDDTAAFNPIADEPAVLDCSHTQASTVISPLPSMAFNMFPVGTSVSILPRTAGTLHDVPRIAGSCVLRPAKNQFPGGSKSHLGVEKITVTPSVSSANQDESPLVPATRMDLVRVEREMAKHIPETRLDLAKHSAGAIVALEGSHQSIAAPSASVVATTREPSLVEQIQSCGFSKEHAEEAVKRVSSIEAAVEWICANRM